MTDQQQSATRARGLARQATEDRIRAERTLDVLRRKEQDLCNAALLAEAAQQEYRVMSISKCTRIYTTMSARVVRHPAIVARSDPSGAHAVITLEGQRLSLLSHLETSGNLMKNTYPIVSARMLEVAKQLRNSYEAAPPKSLSCPHVRLSVWKEPFMDLRVNTMRAGIYRTGPAQSAPF